MELNGQSCLGLSSRKRLKKQSFRGVGSQIASDTVKLFPSESVESMASFTALPLLLSRLSWKNSRQ